MSHPRPPHWGTRTLRDLLCGALIGAGAILPGVSGGVLAVVFGVYQPVMETLTHPRTAIPKYWCWAIPLGLGWAVGFLGLAKGIAAGLPPAVACVTAILGNLLPVPFIMLLVRRIFDWLRDTRFFGPKIVWLERRAHLKGRIVRKYRLLGLVLLVGIPLPGTGAWTGALVASLLDIRLRNALPAVLLGLVIAGGITTAVTLGVSHLF